MTGDRGTPHDGVTRPTTAVTQSVDPTSDDEMIEAAARAVANWWCRSVDREPDDEDEEIAAAVLAAVSPLIRAKLAEQIEAEQWEGPRDDAEISYNAALQQASDLVRGGTDA